MEDGSLHKSRAQKRTLQARAPLARGHPRHRYQADFWSPAFAFASLTAARTFDGPINAALFKDRLGASLHPRRPRGTIVVVDNPPAHKGPRVEQLIKAAGAELRWGPAYQSRYEPNQKAFSKLKAFLRKIAERTVLGLSAPCKPPAEIFKTLLECVKP